MKNKTLLTALSLFAAMQTMAQTTLTAASNTPRPGEVFYGHAMDTTGQSKGPAGAGVAWTFTTTATIQDTTTYISCELTPYCDSFPGSTLAAYNNGDYTYCQSGGTGFRMLGANSAGQLVHLTNSLTQVFYPFSYGNTASDTGYGVLNALFANVHLWLYNTATADAWGTLTLPSGTFSNALRVHATLVTKDSVDFAGFPSVNYSATETYSWYVADFHNPILTITYDTAGTGSSHITAIEYYTQDGTTGISGAEQTTQPSIQVYPTPASDNINVEWNGIADDIVTISITDVTGKTLAWVQNPNHTTNPNTITLPVNAYSNGMYFLNIRSQTQSLSQKIVIRR